MSDKNTAAGNGLAAEGAEPTGPAPEVDLTSDGDGWDDEQKFRQSLTEAAPEGDGEQVKPAATDDGNDDFSLYEGIPGADEIHSEGEEAKPAATEAPKDAPKPAEAAEKPATEPASEVGGLEKFNQFFPGENIASEDDLRMIGQRFNATQQTLDAYEKLVEDNPELGKLIAGVAEGKPLQDVLSETLPELTEAEPDKAAEPEKWAEWRIKQSELAAKRQQAAEKSKAASKTRTNRNQTLQKSFGAFVQRASLKGEDVKAFEKQVMPFINGQATERGDYFDILNFGLNRDALLDAARIEGRNAVLAELKAGKTPDAQSNQKQRSMKKALPIPQVDSRQTEIQPASRQDRELLHMQRTFSDDSVDDLMGDF